MRCYVTCGCYALLFLMCSFNIKQPARGSSGYVTGFGNQRAAFNRAFPHKRQGKQDVATGSFD
jgi:hypothetical protein